MNEYLRTLAPEETAEPQDGAPAAVRVFRGPVGFGEASRDPTVLPGLVEGGGVVAAVCSNQ